MPGVSLYLVSSRVSQPRTYKDARLFRPEPPCCVPARTIVATLLPTISTRTVPPLVVPFCVIVAHCPPGVSPYRIERRGRSKHSIDRARKMGSYTQEPEPRNLWIETPCIPSTALSKAAGW